MNGAEHKINDYVMSRTGGICKIADIKKMSFPGIGERLYYVISPVYDEHSLSYIPVDTKKLGDNIRRVLSVDEINTIIDETEILDYQWIEDSKLRIPKFEEILNKGDRAGVLWLFKVLSIHKLQTEKNKKKLYASETRILEESEKMITEEFAFALGLDRDEVIPYIVSRIDKNNK